jgi:hypothetical protein
MNSLAATAHVVDVLERLGVPWRELPDLDALDIDEEESPP